MTNQLKGEKSTAKKGYNLVYFAAAMTAYAGTVDVGKDALSDLLTGKKELDVEGAYLDNVLALVGTSKYNVDNQKGLGSMIAAHVAGVPLTQLYRAADALSKGDVSDVDMINKLPYIGPLNRKFEIVD
jgi:hypothetical protein